MSEAATAPSSLSRSAVLMGFGTVLSRVSGFGRLLALLYVLGVDQLADTYNLANNVPNMVYELIVGGVLSATLVPVFVREFTNRNGTDAWKAVSAILSATMAVLALATLALVMFAPQIVSLYTWSNDDAFTKDQTEVATFLLRLFAPQILVYGFIGVATGLLHARRSFGPPMFAPIFNNIAIICMLLALHHVVGNISPQNPRLDTAGLLLLGIGTTAGVFAMGALLIPFVRRQSGGRMTFHWDPRHEAVHTVLRMSGWTVGFVIANQVALWVTTVLATRGNDGDLTAFFSAYTLFILPHGIIAVSIMSALQPDLAEHWSRERVAAFRSQAVSGVRLIVAIMLPAAVGYALLSDAIAMSVLNHGEVGSTKAHTAGRVLFWMVIGLPGFSAFIYVTRVLQSMHDARTVFNLYVVQNGLNILTAFPLYAAMGVTGLALSQSLSYAAAAAVGILSLRRRLDGFGGATMYVSFVRVAGATAMMGASVIGIMAICDGIPLAQIGLGVLVGVVVYVVAGRALNVSELRMLRGRLPFPRRGMNRE